MKDYLIIPLSLCMGLGASIFYNCFKENKKYFSLLRFLLAILLVSIATTGIILHWSYVI